jgi:zinc protease
MKSVQRWALVTALATSASSLAAQAVPDSALPAPQAVIGRFVEAIGGRGAVERLPSRWERGRVEIPAQGLIITWELVAAGGRIATRSEMEGFGTIRTGFDGTVAWTMNPAAGPMILEGNAAEQARQSADPLAVLHPDRYVASMRTVEATDFDGVRCYRVRVTTPWGESYDELFDAATGLLRGQVRSQSSPQGEIEVTTRIGEYHTVAGVRLPRVIRASLMGMLETITTVDSTEVRPIADSLLAAPPEIRTLHRGS